VKRRTRSRRDEIENIVLLQKIGSAVKTKYRGATKEEHRGGTKVSWRAERWHVRKNKLSCRRRGNRTSRQRLKYREATKENTTRREIKI